MGLVRALGIILAQPTPTVLGPVIQVIGRSPGKGLRALGLAQPEQLVLQPGHQLSLDNLTDIGFDIDAVQKSHDQGGVVGQQQPPSRVIAP